MIEEINIKKPDDVIINILKDMLEKAESGDIQTIAIAGIDAKLNPFNLFSGQYYPTSLIGSLRLLERDIVDLCCEVRKDVSWDVCNV